MESHYVEIHHIGYAVRSIEAEAPRFAQLLGATWDEVIYHDPLQQARVSFLKVGNSQSSISQFELIEGDSAASPLSRFVAKGGGLHHLCYQVSDLDAHLARMRALGAVLVKGAHPAVAFGGRRVAWMFTRPNATRVFGAVRLAHMIGDTLHNSCSTARARYPVGAAIKLEGNRLLKCKQICLLFAAS